MFSYKKKKMRSDRDEDDDEEEGAAKSAFRSKMPGAFRGKVMDENKPQGSLYGNHASGSSYPQSPKERFSKGKPSKMPGCQNDVKNPMDESRPYGDHYGNHGFTKEKSSNKEDADMPMKEGSTKMNRKKHRKDMAIMMIAQKMKKR